MLQYLFVYGTLRKNKSGDLHTLLHNQARYINSASMPGKLYEIQHYPGAVPAIAASGCLVHGEVYLLLYPHRLLQVLDNYEECTDRFPQPHEYLRKQRAVTLTDGRILNAWTYLYYRPVSGLIQITSGDYFDYLSNNHASGYNHIND
jgi:gamma-glutamylcyclotransferase (GGCT)/AIG2-like uncharacterized protein YtfP